MEELKTIECPQIRYHITYDEDLTLKDLEDLINLIRVANNDVLQEMGISRAKGNGLQRVEKIQPGSIDIVTVLSVVSSVISIGTFLWSVKDLIINKADAEYDKDLRGTGKDRKVHNKNKITVNIDEHNDIHIDKSYTMNIHIHNAEDIRTILEILKSNSEQTK